MRFLFLFLLLTIISLNSCSVLIDRTEMDLICKIENKLEQNKCPSFEEVQSHIDLYEKCFNYDFSIIPLKINWWDPNKRWNYQGRKIVGFSNWEGTEINVSSFRTLTHKLNHIRLAREYKDPDPNHSKFGGPWTEADDVLISIINDTNTCEDKSWE